MLEAVTDANERTATPPVTLNILRGSHTPDKNGGQTADAGSRSKSKSPKKDSAADSVLVASDPVPAHQVASLPLVLSIQPAGDVMDKRDGENPEPPSTKGHKPAPGKIAEASAQPRTALPVAPESQPDPDQPLAVDANAADGSLSKIDAAFEMRLESSEDASDKPETPPPAKGNTPEPAGPAAATAPEAVPGVTQTASSSSKQSDSSRHPAQERAQEAAIVTARPNPSAEPAPTNFDVNALTPPAASTTSPTPAISHSEAPVEAAVPAPAPQPASTPATHDIKLELNGGGQRVEVRLTERGGDIHVAVRTPDARLSDAMRQDLPALAAKLEQSGFRADGWQPGSAAGNERRALETGAGNASQDSHENAGQNQQQKQDNPQPQHPKNFTNAPNRKSDRKDFAWLLQTYR
jgi:hypothetical protein